MKHLKNYKIFEELIITNLNYANSKISEYIDDLKYWLVDHDIIVSAFVFPPTKDHSKQLCIQILKKSFSKSRYFELDDICDYINTTISLIESEGLILHKVNYYNPHNRQWENIYWKLDPTNTKNDDIFKGFNTKISIESIQFIFDNNIN